MPSRIHYATICLHIASILYVLCGIAISLLVAASEDNLILKRTSWRS